MKNTLPLHPYQQYCKNFIKNKPFCSLFLDMGLGKSLITLSALLEINPTHPVLVIAPLNIARSTWIDEIEKWNIPIRHKSLIINEKGKKYSKKKRLEEYNKVANNEPMVYFINQELVPDLVEHFQSKFPFKTLIIDEMQGFKNYGSVRFKSLQAVRPLIQRIIGLTGTPAPNGLMDLWAQINLLDCGYRLGKNITTYRNTFFTPGFIVDNHPVSWNLLPGAKEEIYKRIADITISIENPNLNIPPLTFSNTYAHMTEKEKKNYETLKKEFVLDLPQTDEERDPIIAQNAAVLIGKLTQLASGTIYTGEEDKKYEIFHTQKLDILDYIIENSSSNILLAYYFKSDLDMITNRLIKNKQDFIIFDGNPEIIKKWNKKEIPILLIHPMSAGHGLNLQHGGSTLIWYTLPWSLEHYLQTNKRLHRQGQTNPVIIHHILTKDTVDNKILTALKRKQQVQDGLIDAVKEDPNDLINLIKSEMN